MSSTPSEHLFARRFPEKVGHVGTHYEDCYHSHPSCAWRVGYSDGYHAAMNEARVEMEVLLGLWDEKKEDTND